MLALICIINASYICVQGVYGMLLQVLVVKVLAEDFPTFVLVKNESFVLMRSMFINLILLVRLHDSPKFGHSGSP